MGWFSNLFNRKKEDARKSKTVRIAKVKSLIDPTLNYAQTTTGSMYAGSGYSPPEYNLAVIGQAEDTDSFVMQAHLKKIALMFKEGETFFSENIEALTYIEKRMGQIERASNKSFWNLLVSIGHDLIRYSNAFVVKVRGEFDSKGNAISGGKVRTTPNGKKLQPVAAYFHLSPETIEIKRDKNTGKIVAYRQMMPDGSKKEWSVDSVIHFVFNKKGHFDIGTPSLIPVLDDIRALRRIEQNIEILIYQHLFPLYQYVVGTEAAPAEVYSDMEDEIDLVRQEIEYLPSEGMIVTPERHSIKPVGAEGKALKIDSYVEHFKKRIIAGLGMSQVDFGDGATANRATADNMSRQSIDNVKFYQQVLSDQIQTHMIQELLLESTFTEDVLGSDLFVGHRFKEIDIEQRIKKENHAALMYQANIITELEVRGHFNLGPLSDKERQDLYMHKVEQPKMKFEADLNAKITASTNAGPSGAMANKNNPSNQHGVKSSPEKRKSFVVSDRNINTRFNNLKHDLTHLYERDGDSVNPNYIRQLIISGARQIKDEYEKRVTYAMIRGAVDAGLPRNQAIQLANRRARHIITRFDSDVDRLYLQINRLIQSVLISTSEDKLSELRMVFNSLEYRTRFIDVTDIRRAENYGKAQAMLSLGAVQAVSRPQSPPSKVCDICRGLEGQAIDLLSAGIESIPPHHPMCNCTLENVENVTGQQIRAI